MNNICITQLGGPFDNCLECAFLGSGCSGPRTTAMTHERYEEWLKALKKLRRVTAQNIADNTGLAKTTVDDIFGGRRKDMGRTTAGMIEDYLIGGDAKWPCAMEIVADKEVVYEDRPETLDALKERAIQVENLRRNYDDLKNSVDRELERVRVEFAEDIRFYREQIDLLRDQLKRKDRYIDILMETAIKGGDLTAIDVKGETNNGQT